MPVDEQTELCLHLADLISSRYSYHILSLCVNNVAFATRVLTLLPLLALPILLCRLWVVLYCLMLHLHCDMLMFSCALSGIIVSVSGAPLTIYQY